MYRNRSQCRECQRRPISFELQLTWPASYYLYSYFHVFRLNPVNKIINFNQACANDIYAPDIWRRFTNLSLDDLHSRFTIHNIIMKPNECQSEDFTRRTNNPNRNNLRLQDIGIDIIEDLEFLWPSIHPMNNNDNDQFINLGFWNYQWHKHGSCTPAEYFRLGLESAVYINNISRIAYEYTIGNRSSFRFKARILSD